MLALLIPIVVQILVPVGFLIWQWQGRLNSWLEWWLKTILVGSYFLGILLADLWLLVPWYVGYLYLAVFLLVTLISFFRKKSFKGLGIKGWQGWFRIALYAGAIALLMHILLNTVSAYSLPPIQPVSLSFPLKNGTYYIANGGSVELLNSHLDLLRSKRLQELRGTTYAVDIVKLNSIGLRATGLQPTDPAQYAIFGDPLYAPCGGEVLQSVNTLPDMPPPKADSKHEKGNFVLLQCQPEQAVVFMAHLKQGSVKVSAGDRVLKGQRLGSIGNSGASEEPHLHINAQRSGSSKTALDGDPLPILFEGRYLVRNARVESH